MAFETIRWFVGQTRQSRPWVTGHSKTLWRQKADRGRNRRRLVSDAEHLAAAVAWLERAQDVTGAGGISGRYSLTHGWTSAYPETTGYIVPTFLALADEGQARFRQRAADAVGFLAGLQLESGAFPGGEVQENRTDPSVFNTAQILTGLVAWHRATGAEEVLAAATRAADWLCDVQDEDGAWRRHVYHGYPTTYSAHASCWLAEIGVHVGVERYRGAAERHLDWVLASRDAATGWFDLAGFTTEEHEARVAVTHTIAYTLWGTLLSGQWLDRPDAVEAVAQAADGIRRRIELSGWLPGMLNHQWRRASSHACLTGNAQMALIWMRLYELDGDARWLNAAWKSLDCIHRAHDLDNANPGIRGGVQGSDPIWGEYVPLTLPNWAAKFYVDALRTKRAILLTRIPATPVGWVPPASAPLPPVPATPVSPAPRVVLLTSPYGLEKVDRMLDRWESWGFRPAAIIVERRPIPGALHRLKGVLRDDGFAGMWSRVRSRVAANGGGNGNGGDGYAVATGVPVVEVASLDSPGGLESVRQARPDVLVHAGAGILRRALLEIPRLGTLNAHMGLLPRYRGMNVAEWALLEGSAVGCTVHLIDPGIDTGAIFATRCVPVTEGMTVASLRAAVDDVQLALLGAVLRGIVATGELPPATAQRADAGVQFFRMHPDLVALVEARLSALAPAGPGPSSR